MDLAERTLVIDLLEAYSLFLEDYGYMDMDWRIEDPYAIDKFLKIHDEQISKAKC